MIDDDSEKKPILNDLISSKIEIDPNEEKLKASNNFFSQSDFNQASKIYLSLVEDSEFMAKQSGDTNLEIYEKMVKSFYEVRSFKEATKYAYEIITKFDYKNILAYTTLFKVLLEYNELKKAKELEDKIKSVFKDDPDKLNQFEFLFVSLSEKENEKKSKEIYQANKKKQTKLIHLVDNLKGWLYVGGFLFGSIILYKYLKK